ncbi:unnamed protein product, partial [Prorocentrum cordatum]
MSAPPSDSVAMDHQTSGRAPREQRWPTRESSSSAAAEELQFERAWWAEALKAMITEHLADQMAAIKEAGKKIEALEGPVVEIGRTQRLQAELQQTQQLQMQQLQGSVLEIRQAAPEAAVPVTTEPGKRETHLQDARPQSASPPADGTPRATPPEAPPPPGDSPRAKSALAAELGGVVRAAVREELGELLAEGGPLRGALRSEAEAALGSCGCSPCGLRLSGTVTRGLEQTHVEGVDTPA